MLVSAALAILAGKVPTYKPYINNEENTKLALVLPMLRALGYDVEDPRVLQAEYKAGFKTANWADFAILDGKSKQPLIIIEAKALGEDLSLHHPQLSSYYYSTHPTFAVLTNGTQYWWYADLNKKNIIDDEPFLKFDLENPKDMASGYIEFFASGFDRKQALNRAKALKALAPDPKPPTPPIAPPALLDPSACFDKVAELVSIHFAKASLELVSTKTYTRVSPVGKSTNICRFVFLPSKTYIVFHQYLDNEEKHEIISVNDIEKYKSQLLACAQELKQ